MKVVKYLLMGALVMSSAAPALAQEDSKAIIQQATSIIKSKAPDVADQIKDIAKKNKKNEEVLTGIGRAYLEVKDTANAADFVSRALARNNSYAPAWILKGDLAVSEDNGGAAAQAYEQAIDFDPKEPDAYYKYAMVMRGVSPESSAQKLEQLRQQRPDYPVDQLIGHIFYNAQEYQKAADNYGKVSDVKAMKPEYITEYAMAEWLLGNREKSLEVCKAGLSKDPRKAAWNRISFYNYTDLKKTDDALAFADKLFHASDSAHFIAEDYIYYGTALQQAQRWDDAIHAYEQALDSIKGNAKQTGIINKNLSDVYLQKGDFDNAVAYLEKSFGAKLTEDNFDALGSTYNSIAAKKAAAGDKAGATEYYNKAIENYKKFMAQYPNNTNWCNYQIASVCSNLDPELKQGLALPYQQALIEALEKKENKGQNDEAMLGQAYFYMTVYYINVKQDKESGKAWAQKLLSIDPDNSVAKQVMAL